MSLFYWFIYLYFISFFLSFYYFQYCSSSSLFLGLVLGLATMVVLTLLLSYGASTPLAASTETSGVRDSMSGTPIAYVNSIDVLNYGRPI